MTLYGEVSYARVPFEFDVKNLLRKNGAGDEARTRNFYPPLNTLLMNIRPASVPQLVKHSVIRLLRSLQIIDVRFQNRIVGKLRKIVRGLWMANENFVIGRHQQNREWSLAPIRPYVITYGESRSNEQVSKIAGTAATRDHFRTVAQFET